MSALSIKENRDNHSPFPPPNGRKRHFPASPLVIEETSIASSPTMAPSSPSSPELEWVGPPSERATDVFNRVMKAVRTGETDVSRLRGSSAPFAVTPKGAPSPEISGVVFKPIQNEVYKEGSRRLREGIEPTRSSLRECIAYCLDPKHVPPTAMLTLRSPIPESPISGRGSGQCFVRGKTPNAFSSTDLQLTLQQIDPIELQRLYLFDLRTGNTDRNQGNLIITDDYHLKFIDHGAILASRFIDPFVLCWMDWNSPSLHLPFPPELIDTLNWERDTQMILSKDPNFPLEELAVLRIAESIIRAGTRQLLTPYQIACFFIQGETLTGPLGLIYDHAQRRAGNDRELFFAKLEQMLNQIIVKYSQSIQPGMHYKELVAKLHQISADVMEISD